MGTQASGGYLVAPVETSEDIVKQVDNLVFVRQWAKKYKLQNAQSLGVRQMTARVSDADWTSEVGSLTADSALAFGRRDLSPSQLTKLVLVSIRLMETGIDVEPIVNEELAYKFGVSQEKGFLVGTGSTQPLGVFTASASGVPTAQDVTSGATADFVADDLIKMKYSLKQPYYAGPGADRVMGRSIIQEVRTFKDSYGQYLWRPGLAGDKQDTILDVPVAISEYVPVVKTAGSYIAVLELHLLRDCRGGQLRNPAARRAVCRHQRGRLPRPLVHRRYARPRRGLRPPEDLRLNRVEVRQGELTARPHRRAVFAPTRHRYQHANPNQTNDGEPVGRLSPGRDRRPRRPGRAADRRRLCRQARRDGRGEGLRPRRECRIRRGTRPRREGRPQGRLTEGPMSEFVQNLATTAPPAEEPVSLALAKQHCRVEISDDDNLFSGLIAAGRDFAEKATRRAFVQRTYELRMGRFPHALPASSYPFPFAGTAAGCRLWRDPIAEAPAHRRKLHHLR